MVENTGKSVEQYNLLDINWDNIIASEYKKIIKEMTVQVSEKSNVNFTKKIIELLYIEYASLFKRLKQSSQICKHRLTMLK